MGGPIQWAGNWKEEFKMKQKEVHARMVEEGRHGRRRLPGMSHEGIRMRAVLFGLALLLAFAVYPGVRSQEIEWVRQFGCTICDVYLRNDFAEAVSADADRNAYVAGSTNGTLPGQTDAGNYDAFVRKYDSNGNEVWTRQFGTTGRDCANGIC